MWLQKLNGGDSFKKEDPSVDKILFYVENEPHLNIKEKTLLGAAILGLLENKVPSPASVLLAIQRIRYKKALKYAVV